MKNYKFGSQFNKLYLYNCINITCETLEDYITLYVVQSVTPNHQTLHVHSAKLKQPGYICWMPTLSYYDI